MGYAKAPAPEVAGTWAFATVVRGDDADGRNLVAMAPIDGVSAIDSIVVGPVLPGNGIAWISAPVAADSTETGPLPGGSGDLDGDEKTDTVIPGNSRYNPNKRLVSAGNTGVSVVMNFEAVGTMDGGEVEFTVPALWIRHKTPILRSMVMSQSQPLARQ